jgi:hypothetical protein
MLTTFCTATVSVAAEVRDLRDSPAFSASVVLRAPVSYGL